MVKKVSVSCYQGGVSNVCKGVVVYTAACYQGWRIQWLEGCGYVTASRGCVLWLEGCGCFACYQEGVSYGWKGVERYECVAVLPTTKGVCLMVKMQGCGCEPCCLLLRQTNTANYIKHILTSFRQGNQLQRKGEILEGRGVLGTTNIYRKGK